MKTVLQSILTAVLALSSVASGAVVASDDFSTGYADGSIAGQNPSNPPFSGAWTGSNLVDTTVQRTVDIESGSVVVTDTSNAPRDYYAQRDISLGGTAPAASYLGFDFTTGNSLPGGAFVAKRFGDKAFVGAGIDHTTGELALFAGFEPLGGAFEEPTYFASGIAANVNTTYRLVVKVSNDGLNDPLALFVNPGSTIEGTPDFSTTGNWYVAGNTSYTLNALRIGKQSLENGNADDGSYTLDNLVISDDFASATAIPEPSSLALLGLTGLAGALVLRRRH
jgi:hypothetical protein